MEMKAMMGNAEMTFKEIFKGVKSDMQNCMQCCSTTSSLSEQMMTYCLRKGGEMASAKMICMFESSAQVCMTTCNLMMWESSFTMKMASLCAEVCTSCAKECEKMSSSDKMMKTMAEMYRSCAECCTMMAKSH